jgi:hypothetical protein
LENRRGGPRSGCGIGTASAAASARRPRSAWPASPGIWLPAEQALLHAPLGLAHDAQQLHHLALGHRLAVEEALPVLAIDRAQEADVLLGLDTSATTFLPSSCERATTERRITEPVPFWPLPE